MEEGTDVASVPLKHDSLEFKMVASEFKRTLGGYTLQQIHEVCIWRILGKCCFFYIKFARQGFEDAC